MSSRRLLLAGEAGVVGLYLCSLFQPAFLFADNKVVAGLELMFWGWWGILMMNAGWLANPLALGSAFCLFLKRARSARILGTTAFLCSLNSLLAREYYFNEGSGTPIQGFGPAVYIWMSAIGLQCLLAWVTR